MGKVWHFVWRTWHDRVVVVGVTQADPLQTHTETHRARWADTAGVRVVKSKNHYASTHETNKQTKNTHILCVNTQWWRPTPHRRGTGKVEGQFLHAGSWQWSPILDAHPIALWTGEGLGWGWSGCCSLFLPPASFLCSLMSLCLTLTTGFTHWYAPPVLSEDSCCHDWRLVPTCASRLFSWSLEHFLGALQLHFPS